MARSQDTRGAIVTDNLKHFPEDKIPPGIQIVSPSEFAANTVDVSPAGALRAVTAIAARFDKQPMSVDEFLSILRERATGWMRLINDVR